MANDKDKVKTSNPKSKDWEKRRRDKLGDAFKLLAQLLPHHDPAKLPSKIHILNRATEFIKELRLSNSRLLTTKNQPNEMSTKINELQDEVNKLILRVKQLTTLLDQAKIPIPQGPCIQSLGKREFKWSRKLTADDVENLGILLNSGKPIKKNKKSKVTLHVTTTPNAQILEDNDNSSKTASTVKDKEVEKRENDKTQSTEASKSVEVDILKSKSEQTKSNSTPIVLPAKSPASKESIEPIAVPPKTKIIVTDLSKKELITDTQTQTTAKQTKEDLITNKKDLETVKCATIENKTVNSITISPSKSLNVTLIQPQLVTTSAPMIFTPLTLFSTGGMRNLAPLLPKVLPGVVQKLPIFRIKRELVPKKIRARRRKKVEQTIVDQKDSVSVPAPTSLLTKDVVPNSPPPEVITIVEEELNADEAKRELEVNPQVVSSEEIKQATNSCTEPKITEQNVEEMEIGVDIEKLDNGKNKAHSPKEMLPDNQVQPKESDKTEIVLEPSVLETTAATDNSAPDPPIQNSTKSPRCEAPVSNRELKSVPPVAAVEQIENTLRNNERNDVFSFNDENGSPSCTSPVKISECIARSIGISMEQDEVESDLMELNTDWTGVVDPSCSQSPKSCISPTQMFLSCFPLLPRDGNISTELPSQVQPNFIKSATLPSSNSRPSSFCINSMLPNDPNQIQPYTTIENPFTASSSLCKKIIPSDSFEKVLAPLQTFKSSKLLSLPPTIPTTTTTSSNSLDLYSDKGLMWFSDYLNPVNKDSASANTLSSTRTFPRIVSSQHEKQSVQSSASEVRSLLSGPILKDHSNSKEISKPQGSGNSRAKYSKTQPQQPTKDCPPNAKEKELPRIPIPEHQPHFAFPIQTPKSSKSRTIHNPTISQQTTPQKQRQPHPYPYQSIQKIIDYQSPPVNNSSEYQSTKFIHRTEPVSQTQYPNPTTSSASRPSQLHSNSSPASTQFQHQPSLPKSSYQPSFSSNEYSRYSLNSYPQSNRNDTQTNQVTYPPPPVYQPSAPSRIPTSTAPLYLPPPVATPCENSTRAVVFPPSVPTNTNQCQMDYSQLGDTTYHADFSSHHNSNNSSVAMNPELNNYFGTTHHTHQNQNSKKQELRSAINTQISPRPIPNLASNRGTSSNLVPSSSSSSQSQHYQHQRPVNWMTETRTTSKKGTSRGTSFSVSKLVDQPNPPAPVSNQQIPDKNYYTDVLLSKTSFSNRTGNYNSLEWGQPHYGTPTTNENPFMFQNTHQTTTQNPDPQHQHNFQLGFQDPNQSSYYPGNPTSHNQQHQVGLSTPQYFVDYGHVGQSTVNSVTPYQQNQHHYHNPHGSSVSNFNLSSLFPEIADKNPSKNHNTHMRNPNNNSNASSTQNQNSLNLLDPYSANTISSGLNNFSNISIPPFSSGSSTDRKNQHHS